MKCNMKYTCRYYDWLNGFILMKWVGFISFDKSLLKLVLFMFLFHLYLVNVYIICKNRSSTLLDIWFWCSWYNFSNYATLKLHTSPFFAAFHFCFLTLVFKYSECIHLFSKRFHPFYRYIYPSNSVTFFLIFTFFVVKTSQPALLYYLCILSKLFI